jgi:hypothetical protein
MTNRHIVEALMEAREEQADKGAAVDTKHPIDKAIEWMAIIGVIIVVAVATREAFLWWMRT